MLKHLAFLATLLILVSCGTNKIRFGKKHHHVQVTPVETSKVDDETTDSDALDVLPITLSDSTTINNNQDTEIADSKDENSTYSANQEVTHNTPESEIEPYPGQKRKAQNVGRKILGSVLITFGVLGAIGVIVGNIGAYGVALTIIVAPIVGILLVVMGILLIRVRDDRRNLKIFGIILMVLSIFIAAELILLLMLSFSSAALLLTLFLLILDGLILWLGIALVRKANQHS